MKKKQKPKLVVKKINKEQKKTKNKVGRPPKRTSPKVLEEQIDNYFKSISIKEPSYRIETIPIDEETKYEVLKNVYKMEPIEWEIDDDGEMKTHRVWYKEIKIPILNDLWEHVYKILWLEEPTITWLALYLWTTRDVLLDYQKKDEFSNTIKRWKILVEHFYEMRLVNGWWSWSIFALKNFWRKDNKSIDFKDKTDDSENIDPEEMTPEQLKEFIKENEKKLKSLNNKK